MARSSDLTRPRQEVYATLDAESHRRFIKTHTPLDGIPLDPAVTYIVTARHPLDMAISLYRQGDNIDRLRVAELTGQSQGPEPATERKPLRDWLVDWIDHDAEPQGELDSLPGVRHVASRRRIAPSPASSSAVISATWSSALMITGPLPRGGGPLRHGSRSDTRDPGEISSSWSSTYRWPAGSRPSSTAHSRRVCSSRILATSRASVLTPGNSTFRFRSHATPSRKIAFGPSPDVHDRAATQPTNSFSTSGNSCNP